MTQAVREPLVSIEPGDALWERFFTVAPLVLVGTREPDGGYDLAPKHMVMPLSWQGHIGFVCVERHATYRNARREGAFTMSYLRPGQIMDASLAAAPRCEDDYKMSLDAVTTFPAARVDGVLVAGGYVYLECELDRIVDGFAENSLVAGRVVAARVHEEALRAEDRDDQDLVRDAPLLAYLHPGRFAAVGETRSFPFPAGMKR